MEHPTIETELIEQEELDFSLVNYAQTPVDDSGIAIKSNTVQSNNSVVEEQERILEKNNEQLRQILNSLLPPIRVPNATDAYKQVSMQTPTRDDVINLQRIWDHQLQERQARETGICAIREQLNSQAFDELIRQMTINLPERGLLAVRVRDEAKMTIDTYQTLYHTSLGFGMRKCVQVE